MAKKIPAKSAKKSTIPPLTSVGLKKSVRKAVTLTDIAKANKPIKPEVLAKLNKKDDASAWVEADDQMKKEAASKKDRKPAVATIGSPTPVESHLPGVPRVPKPKKVIPPLAAPAGGLGLEPLAHLEIVSYHFLKLMERLAAEQGGTSAQALEDLRADIAKRKKP